MAYEDLTEEQKVFVTNLVKLIAVETKIAELEEKEVAAKVGAAILAANEAIEALPSVENVTLEDKEAVVAARDLIGEVQALDAEATVSGENRLIELEGKIAKLGKEAVSELLGVIEVASDRKRPEYTANISEWDKYWKQFVFARTDAVDFTGKIVIEETLSVDETQNLVNVISTLRGTMEVLDGIEDFDSAFGDRQSPKGFEKTINDQSKTTNGDNRLRVDYDESTSTITLLLSEKLQRQSYLTGTKGIGIKTGLLYVMKSKDAYKVSSNGKYIELYNSNGTKRTDSQIEGEGASIGLSWVGSLFGNYSNMVGKKAEFILFGRTESGIEFQRSYMFEFVDAGVHEFTQ